MTREHNWADNHTFAAARFCRPTSIGEARRLVAVADRIHAIGTRHSFNGIADTPGTIIDLGGLDPGCEIDRERGTVTVGAGTSYGVLARFLNARGFALHNMASLPHISVAGATATGTHGSGDRNRTLSAAVAGLEFVAASGDHMGVRRGDADFDGMVVGLGAFGVVTRVTLDVEPAFAMRQDSYAEMPWDVALANFDAVMALGDSVSLMTMWSTATVGRLWIKRRAGEGDAAPDAIAARFGAVPASPAATNDPVSTLRLNEFGVVGPWCDRLPHFRRDVEPGPDEQIQSEYMLPRGRALEALSALRAIGAKIDPLLLLTEIRTMASDRLWLSPAFGDDAVAIHFTWRKEPDAVAAITGEIEDLLIPLGGRPHWGKLMHAPAERLLPLYPEMPRFRALAERYDPSGKFLNDFLARHVFG